MIHPQLPPDEKVARLFEEKERILALARQGEALISSAIKTARQVKLAPLDHFFNDERPACLMKDFAGFLDRGLWEQLLVLCAENAFIDTFFARHWNHHWRDHTPFDREGVDQALARLASEMHKLLPRAIGLSGTILTGHKGLVVPYQGTLQSLFNMRWKVRSINSDRMEELDQHHRLMCLADGMACPEKCELPSAWLRQEDYTNAPWRRYFEVQLFKNGNAKITHNRRDLVDGLNAVVAKWKADNPQPTG